MTAPEQKPNRTLLQISDDAQALNELLEEIGGDISDPQVAAAVDKWLQENDSNLQSKIDSYCGLIGETESRAAARKAEAKRLQELAKIDENKAARLKERLKYFFEVKGLTKLETLHYKLSIAQNGGKLPLIINEDTNPHAINESFVRSTLNTDAIREYLESGNELEFAKLGERGTSIRIR